MKECILFGGTFDPIHNGHMAIAAKLHEVFNHQVTFLPTGIPPYKPPSQVLPIERLTMLQLAIGHTNKFAIDTLEIEQDTFCYTYKTLSLIRQQIGIATPLFFVIGSDSLITLNTWDNWQSLFNLTNFIIVHRTGYNSNNMPLELRHEFYQRVTSNLSEFKKSTSGKFYLLDFNPMNISSTKIRLDIKHNLAIKKYVPLKVQQYILEHNLYH